MARILVVYGTTEGQTRKIAEFMAERAAASGHEIEICDATAVPWGLDIDGFAAVIIAGSLHMGRHQGAVEHFVRHHHATLNRMPGAFVSVSLAAAGDAEDRQDARACAEQFLAATGWRPAQTHLVAGAFRYTQYDFFKRWIMRRIAREKGAPTDTSHDYELTDWDDLGRFVDDFLATIGEGMPAGGENAESGSR